MKAYTLAFLAAVAALSFSHRAHAADALPHFKLCSGVGSGNYVKAANLIKSLSSDVVIDVVPTKGSLENLAKVTKGECDGGFTQADAMLVYGDAHAETISALKRAGVLYREDVQLFCNRNAGIADISDLTEKNTIAVGGEGGGTRTTWAAYVAANKDRYGAVRISNDSGQPAMAGVDDAHDYQCWMWVGAANAPLIAKQAAKHGDRTMIVPTYDKQVLATHDQRGEPIYQETTIGGDAYTSLARRGWFGGTKDTAALAVDSLFVVNTDWIRDHAEAYDRVLGAFQDAKPAIADLIKPAQ